MNVNYCIKLNLENILFENYLQYTVMADQKFVTVVQYMYGSLQHSTVYSNG